MRRFISYNK